MMLDNNISDSMKRQLTMVRNCSEWPSAFLAAHFGGRIGELRVENGGFPIGGDYGHSPSCVLRSTDSSDSQWTCKARLLDLVTNIMDLAEGEKSRKGGMEVPGAWSARVPLSPAQLCEPSPPGLGLGGSPWHSETLPEAVRLSQIVNFAEIVDEDRAGTSTL